MKPDLVGSGGHSVFGGGSGCGPTRWTGMVGQSDMFDGRPPLLNRMPEEH